MGKLGRKMGGSYDREENSESSKGPHPDWERNFASSQQLIKENEGKLPEGLSLTVDHYRLMFSFQTPTVAQIATPISLHQDMMSFLPEMRAQLAFYKKGAEYSQANRKQAQEGLL